MRSTYALRRIYRGLLPIRLLCLALIGLAFYGAYVLGPAAVIAQLLLIPLVAVVTDAVLGYLRWKKFRFPWAGLATGLFVAVLIPPQGGLAPVSGTTILLAAATMTTVALIAKNIFRSQGHPWFNPAALALVLAALFFGITPAWWGALSVPAVLLVGIAIALRQPRRWPIPVVFFGTYAALSTVGNFLLLGVTSTNVLVLDIADPSVLFFTLLMVTEPRTSVANPRLQPLYGLSAGLLASLLRFGPGGSTAIAASENLVLALLGANLLAIGLRRFDAALRAGRTVPTPSPRPARPSATRPAWGWGHTAGVSLVALLLIGVSVGLAGSPPAPAPGPPPKLVVVSCTQDNRSIPSSDVAMLHQRLGPSVIFSYDRATGATVFYDPVNKVTVYETDLFEDFGSPEFNGDDQILSNGCSLGAS